MLFGGLRESNPGCGEIELQQTDAKAFRHLLKYIYTGKITLSQLKVVEYFQWTWISWLQIEFFLQHLNTKSDIIINFAVPHDFRKRRYWVCWSCPISTCCLNLNHPFLPTWRPSWMLRMCAWSMTWPVCTASRISVTHVVSSSTSTPVKSSHQRPF